MPLPRRVSRNPPNLHRRNYLLGMLPADAFAFLGPHLEVRSLQVGQTLYDRDAPISHAIFPHDCVVSFMAVRSDGRTAEQTTIGREGVVGFAFFLGGGATAGRSVVQIAGSASVIAVERLTEAAERYPEISQVFLKYSRALLVQTLEVVACTQLHNAEERCCRWLMSANDRVGAGRFYLKQETLAELLGLRRATVGQICSSLQDHGIIQYSRGWLSVLDALALRSRCCECYGKINEIFDSLLPGAYERRA